MLRDSGGGRCGRSADGDDGASSLSCCCCWLEDDERYENPKWEHRRGSLPNHSGSTGSPSNRPREASDPWLPNADDVPRCDLPDDDDDDPRDEEIGGKEPRSSSPSAMCSDSAAVNGGSSTVVMEVATGVVSGASCFDSHSPTAVFCSAPPPSSGERLRFVR